MNKVAVPPPRHVHISPCTMVSFICLVGLNGTHILVHGKVSFGVKVGDSKRCLMMRLDYVLQILTPLYVPWSGISDPVKR